MLSSEMCSIVRVNHMDGYLRSGPSGLSGNEDNDLPTVPSSCESQTQAQAEQSQQTDMSSNFDNNDKIDTLTDPKLSDGHGDDITSDTGLCLLGSSGSKVSVSRGEPAPISAGSLGAESADGCKRH